MVSNKVINPATGRYVDKNGVIGRKLASTSSKRSPSKKYKHSTISESLPTLAEIKDSIPTNISTIVKDENMFLTNADIQDSVRDWYGPYATKFSYRLAKSLPIDTKMYALIGQWYPSMSSPTKQNRCKQLTKIVLGDWEDKYLTIFEKNMDYQIYEYKNYMVSGSGADPIYVFIK